MKKLIKKIEKKITNPRKSLPEDFFLFIGRMTPFTNVDLLIKNNKNETLLTWRKKGEKHLPGWHLPGGIIRFREKINTRINKVAKNELCTKVKFSKKPIAINEIHLNQKNRSHFISLLYLCKLTKPLGRNLKYISGNPKINQWKWFKKSPKNLIPPHKVYKKFINK